MGKSIGESIHKVLNTNPASLKQIRDDIPKWCDKLILNMLDKNPKRRPKSCSEVLENLYSGVTQFADAEFIQHIVKPKKTQNIIPVKKRLLSPTLNKILFAAVTLISLGMILWFSLPDSRISKPQSQVLSTNETKTDNLSADSISAFKVEHINELDPVYKLKTQQTNIPDDVDPAKSNPDIRDVNTKPLETEKNTANGFLYIAAIPWADVYIDGVKKETTPLKKAIIIDPGRHVIDLRNPNFQDYSQSIEIRSGVTDSILIQLESLMGFLQVNVMPWGDIYLNDTYIDTTPLKEPIQINAGTYILKVKNPNFETFLTEIKIKSNLTEHVDIRLQN
jgi:serine/threonine protein kinase